MTDHQQTNHLSWIMLILGQSALLTGIYTNAVPDRQAMKMQSTERRMEALTIADFTVIDFGKKPDRQQGHML